MQKRGCIVAKLMATMLAKAGVPTSTCRRRGCRRGGCRGGLQEGLQEGDCSRRGCRKKGCGTLQRSVCLPAGISHVLTVDLHHKELHGFFDMPVDNLRASPIVINYIKHEVRAAGERGCWGKGLLREGAAEGRGCRGRGCREKGLLREGAAEGGL